jgi:hypothetical protein
VGERDGKRPTGDGFVNCLLRYYRPNIPTAKMRLLRYYADISLVYRAGKGGRERLNDAFCLTPKGG